MISYQNHKQPNIILINCDDLGFGDLGCYGSTRNDTPHIDQLARQGTRMTDFYRASPVCSASRAAMLTGCYPPRVGFGDFHGLYPGQAEALHLSEMTLGSLLRQRGYATKLENWRSQFFWDAWPCRRTQTTLEMASPVR